ncbi:MAG: alpha-xylosidase, partial [Prevotella sp.]|nr:alpha-xylosidase [Prevotella sp.]
MKQTNYHLFDFMDFDPALQQDEALWKAYSPSKIEEHDGDIIVTIPYQKQLHQEDMAADERTPQQSYNLIIRAYEPNIVRLFTTMSGDEMVESDDMLQFTSEVKRQALRLVGCDIIAANGKKIATIDLTEPIIDHWSDLQ